MSPFGGFRQRSVFGPAVRVKYSMHCGREKSGGKFNGVKDELSGGILNAIQICSAHRIISVSGTLLNPLSSRSILDVNKNAKTR